MVVADSGHDRRDLLRGAARSVLSNVGQDGLRQAAAVTKDVSKDVTGLAGLAGQASRSVSRRVTQEDAWEELRGDVELLTEIARAHHALIVDLIDRVAGLEAGAGSGPGAGHGG